MKIMVGEGMIKGFEIELMKSVRKEILERKKKIEKRKKKK